MLTTDQIHEIAEVVAHKWRHSNGDPVVWAIEEAIRATLAKDERQRQSTQRRTFGPDPHGDLMKAETEDRAHHVNESPPRPA